jgi:hypothetical protein
VLFHPLTASVIFRCSAWPLCIDPVKICSPHIRVVSASVKWTLADSRWERRLTVENKASDCNFSEVMPENIVWYLIFRKWIYVQSELLLIYRLFISKGGRIANWIEERFGFARGIALSPGHRRNELYAYETLFSPGQKAELEQLYLELLDEINGVPYPQGGELLDALAFIKKFQLLHCGNIVREGGGRKFR